MTTRGDRRPSAASCYAAAPIGHPAGVEPANRTRVEQFVRGVLGCRCPPDVFSKIEVNRHVDTFHGLPVSATLVIGDRLLILFCAAGVNRESLIELLDRGKTVRDVHGLNRVRCVVSKGSWTGENLQEFETGDDRIHLHRVNEINIDYLLAGTD